MRAETGQHAGDRGLDQLAVGDRFDRIVTDPLEGLAEQVELLVNPALAALLLRHGRSGHEQDGQGERDCRFTHTCGSPRGRLTGRFTKAPAH